MHVHSSFSEGAGSISASLESQVAEALRNGFDVLWATDHDWRMSAYQAPDAFHFSGLSETARSKTYTWRPVASGAVASTSGGVVGTPVSPNDRAPGKGSLRVGATASRRGTGSSGYLLDGKAANQCHRTNLAGQTLAVDVYPDVVGADSWAEVVVKLSYRPAMAGRPAGRYRLVYRLGGSPARRRAQGLVGVVDVRVEAGRWNSVTLDPVADVGAIWPDLVAADNSLVDLHLGVGARSGARARVFYGNLRFTRTMAAGDRPRQAQAKLVAAYARRYPKLAVRQGVEVSGSSEHSNWFGGDQHLIDYTRRKPADLLAYGSARVHAACGLASLNHPFGSHGGHGLSGAAQDKRRRAVARGLLARDLGGVDVVEAGYRSRSGMSLESHLALFDTFSATGTG